MKGKQLVLLCQCGQRGIPKEFFAVEGHRLLIIATCPNCNKDFRTVMSLGFIFTQCPDHDEDVSDDDFLKDAKIEPF